MATNIQSNSYNTQEAPPQGTSSVPGDTEAPGTTASVVPGDIDPGTTTSSPNNVVSSVNGMIAEMQGLVSSLSVYSTTQTKAQQVAANAEALAQIANLNTVNQDVTQEAQQQSREQKFSVLGDIFSGIATILLIPIDPMLSMTSMLTQSLDIAGITQDIVGWISEGLQDIDPNLNDSEAKAIADVIFVVAIVVAAVVIGALTAGAGDAVIAEAGAEVVGEAVAEDVAGDVASDVGKDIGKDVGKDVVGTASKDVAGSVVDDGAKTKAKPTTGQRVKRAAKFGAMLGSQATMQTNMDVNIVTAVASTTSDPDSKAWKAIEFTTFLIQTISCVAVSIGAMSMKTPDFIDDQFTGKSKLVQLRKWGQKAAFGSQMIEALSESVSGGFALAAAHSYNEMKDNVSNMIILKALEEMSAQTGQMVQKNVTDIEKSVFEGQDLTHLLIGYEMPA